MALNTEITQAAANGACNSITALLNSGFLEIYTGTQPATADTGLSGNTLLATLSYGSTAYGSASAGVATANAITSGTAGNTGTATWFRNYKSDGTTAVWDGTVGTSGCNLNLNSVAISSGATVAVSSLTFSVLLAGD